MGRPSVRGLLRRGVPGLGWSPPSAWLQRDPLTHPGPDSPGSSLGSLWAAAALLRLALTALTPALLSPQPLMGDATSATTPPHPGAGIPLTPFRRQNHKASLACHPSRGFPPFLEAVGFSCRVTLQTGPILNPSPHSP